MREVIAECDAQLAFYASPAGMQASGGYRPMTTRQPVRRKQLDAAIREWERRMLAGSDEDAPEMDWGILVATNVRQGNS